MAFSSRCWTPFPAPFPVELRHPEDRGVHSVADLHHRTQFSDGDDPGETGPERGLPASVPLLPNEAAFGISVIGIIGATVMPHNLYLHSSLVQTRRIDRSNSGIRRAIRFNFIDSVIALNLAFFVNAAILGTGASTFLETACLRSVRSRTRTISWSRCSAANSRLSCSRLP